MNRLKGAFEESFQEMKHSERKVKQTVMNAVGDLEQPPSKKKFPKALSAIVALFAIVIVGVLASQYMKPEQKASVIDEKYFEMLLYENYNLSTYFLNENYVKTLTYEVFLRDMAVIDYVENEEGLEIYEERVERMSKDNQDLVYDILKEQPDSWMHYHLEQVEKKFGIDTEQYLQLQKTKQYKAHVAREMLVGVLHEEIVEADVEFDAVDEIAVAKFEEKYSDELNALQEKYEIDPNYEYDVKGQQAVFELDGEKYETIIVEGTEVLKHPFEDVSGLMFQIEDVRMEIERSEGFKLFCYETLDDYKHAAERFIAQNRMVEEASMFLEVVELLRNTAEID